MSDTPRRGYPDYDNQKQLRQGEAAQGFDLAVLSGDAAADNRLNAADEATCVERQALLGGPFMHPMHDASPDAQHAPRAFDHARRARPD